MKKLNRVLLIDDDTATNFITKMIIKKAGITDQIDTALNGKQALAFLTNSGEYAKDEQTYPLPQLILLDINMPIMDGWEFAEAFAKLEEYHKENTTIIMLSSSLNPDDRERALKIPVISGFQNKTLSPEGLASIMKSFFPDYL